VVDASSTMLSQYAGGFRATSTLALTNATLPTCAAGGPGLAGGPSGATGARGSNVHAGEITHEVVGRSGLTARPGTGR